MGITKSDLRPSLVQEIENKQDKQEFNEFKEIIKKDLDTQKAEIVQNADAIKLLNESKETKESVVKQIEQTDYKKYKKNKDSEGIFTTVEYRRSDNTLAIKSVLSGGTSPKYTTRTITYYSLDGNTIEKTTTLKLTYDSEDLLISEV